MILNTYLNGGPPPLPECGPLQNIGEGWMGEMSNHGDERQSERQRSRITTGTALLPGVDGPGPAGPTLQGFLSCLALCCV